MVHLIQRIVSTAQWATLLFLGWYRYSAVLPTLLLIGLTAVNMILFYEFLRTEHPVEQARRGAMLVVWYGVILLWVYDPQFLGLVAGTACGVAVMLYQMGILPRDDSERGG